jgi:hypothetical protein
MAFRTNYRFERAERDRIKKTKKDEKLKRQRERTALHPAPDSSENPDENRPPDELPRATRPLRGGDGFWTAASQRPDG